MLDRANALTSIDAVPSEDDLNKAFSPDYRILCHVSTRGLVEVVRGALQLPPSVSPSELRLVWTRGSFNKVFLVRFESTSVVARVPYDEPAMRDPVRLRSQAATLDFLRIHRPTVPVPRLIGAAFDCANPSQVPYQLLEFCAGTPITITEWYDEMSDASRSSLIELLADLWVKVTAPVPFTAIGSILKKPSEAPKDATHDADELQTSGFRVVPMIPQFPDQSTEIVEPSIVARAVPQTLLEHWTHQLELRRREMLAWWPDNDPATVLWQHSDPPFTLEHAWRCFRVLQELVVVAASLDPLARAPTTALVHADFSFWKNILFSEDRTRVEGVVDWDDAVVVPRDLAALYPDELTHRARWRCDPDDVFAIPADTPYEEQGLWGVAIKETEQRRLWREAIQRRDPELAAMYTDRRARLRRRVHDLVSSGCFAWAAHDTWLLSESLAEAHELTNDRS